MLLNFRLRPICESSLDLNATYVKRNLNFCSSLLAYLLPQINWQLFFTLHLLCVCASSCLVSKVISHSSWKMMTRFVYCSTDLKPTEVWSRARLSLSFGKISHDLSRLTFCWRQFSQLSKDEKFSKSFFFETSINYVTFDLRDSLDVLSARHCGHIYSHHKQEPWNLIKYVTQFSIAKKFECEQKKISNY